MQYTSIIIGLNALLATLCFPPLQLGYVAFVGLIPLLISVRQATTFRQAFFSGFLFGTITIAALQTWMFSLHLYAPWWAIGGIWTVYSLYLGLYYGLACAAIHILPRRYPMWLIAPPAWTLFEYLRALGPIGNPVGTIGYGIIDIIPLPNVAAMGGVYLVSFLVVLINAMLADIVFRRGLGKLVTCFAIFMVVGVWIGFSEIRQMTYTVNADLNPVSIALIQGNHAQMDKFNRRQWATIKEDYLRLTEVALQSSPDIVLWPETITPTLNLEDPLFVSVITRLSHENGSSIVWGTPIRKGSLFYNSIAAVTPGGILPGYLKIKLMPFGEYWPCRPALKAMGLTALLGDDYTGGSQCTLLPLAPTITVGGVICLESLYPWYTRTEAAAGAQLLVVIANNAWFIHSSAAQKHFQMTRMRAIETNRWVALCSNTGVTALVNPLGQPTETLPEDTQGVLHGTATRNRGLTPYTRYGDWIIGLSLMLCIGSGFLRKFRS